VEKGINMNKKLKCYVVIICLSLIGACVVTQEIRWTKTFEKEESNGGFSVLSIEDGFVIAGYMYSGENNRDFWLLKLDREGNEIWSRTYDNKDDIAWDVTKADEGYIIIGTSMTNEDSPSASVMIVKTGWRGEEEWSKTYSINSIYSEGKSIQSVEDGYVIVGNVKFLAGVTGNYENYVFLMKIDKTGEEQWSKTYRGEKEASVSHIVKSEEDYVLLGSTWVDNPSESDLWLQKVDKDGNILWSKKYNELTSNWGKSMLLTEDGFVIAGYTSDGRNSDFWLLKVDREGNKIWSRTYDNEYDIVSCITDTKNGFIIVGFTTHFPPTQMNVMIIKTDKNGKEKWRKIWGSDEKDEVAESICKADSGFMIAGIVVIEKEKADLLLINIEERY